MWEFLRRINQEGTTIILTTHYLEEAESLCRNIAIIDEGRIIENDRMSTVLRKLHTETFVLNLRAAIAAVPALPGYRIVRTDEQTLEVEVNKDQSLNEIFAALSAAGIDVLSMRNKANRLEELFLRLVEGRDIGTGQACPCDSRWTPRCATGAAVSASRPS
jgi:ABC-2 type transport system ATP-binding protein